MNEDEAQDGQQKQRQLQGFYTSFVKMQFIQTLSMFVWGI